jgi:DHA2 family multidrug resistance protein-like MFS transporter
MCTSIATMIVTLSSTIANTALPTIVRSFHITSAQSIWVVNGVQLAMTSTLLFFAAAGDARGAKRLYLAGLGVFTLATIGAAFAPSFGFLVAMRIVQGLGGSALLVTTNALNRALFPKEELGRSVAVNSIFVAVGTAGGPTIGGIILSFLPWPWIFALNVPLGIFAFVMGWKFLPNVPGSGQPLDFRSAALAAAAFGGIFFSLDAVARRMGPLEIGVAATIGIVAMAVFIRRQLHLVHPMLAVELFRVPIFRVSIVASSMVYCAQGIAYVSLPFFFQNVLGKTPLQSGLLLSAWPFAALLIALRMGRLSDRYPAPLLCMLGVVVMGTGLLAYALLPAIPATLAVVGCALVCGAGFATFQTPNNRSIIATAPPEKTSRAAGVMTTARLTGQTLGAVFVAMVFEIASSGVTSRTAPVHSVIQIALVGACICMAIAAVFSSIRLGATARATT